MKKTLVILMAALAALASCNKQLEAPEENNASPAEVTFKLDATHPDGGATKAVKTAWEEGDVIFVFFDQQAAPAYLEMKRESGVWTSTGKNSLALADAESGTMTAVFLPFGSGATVSNDGTDFTFSETYLSYYLTAQLPYTVSGGEVSGTFEMKIPEGFVQFFLDDGSADPATEIELREPNLSPQGIKSIAADGTITLTDLVYGAPLPGYVYDKEAKLSGESKGWLFSGILASGARNFTTDYNFTLVSGGWKGEYYGKTFASQLFYENPTTGRALKLPALSAWMAITDYKPIDLKCDMTEGGVTRRIYWASRNLGAMEEMPLADTDEARRATYGDYYAWGETAPYYEAGYAFETPCSHWATGKTAGYYWGSYSMANEEGSKFGKYTAMYSGTYAISGTSDGKYILEAEDDAAAAKLKGLWRIPTVMEWMKLITFTWNWDSTNKGYVVTALGDTAWTDPTIFLPAAGYWEKTTLYALGESGLYWSATLGESKPFNAISANLNSGSMSCSENYRYFGRSIRPVCD